MTEHLAEDPARTFKAGSKYVEARHMTTVSVERPSDTSGVVRVTAGGPRVDLGGEAISFAPAPRPQHPQHPQHPQNHATAVPVSVPPPAQAPQRPPPPPPSRPLPPAREVHDTLAGLANPSKLRPPSESDPEDDEIASDFGGGSFGGDGVGSPMGGGSSVAGEDEDLPDEENEPFEDELRPSDGFRSLEEEKADIMFKLARYRKRGMPGMRTFSVHSDIRELRAELKRIKTELDMEASIKFQRKMLMAMVSGLEFVNRKYLPFDLQLEGWSETVHTDLNSYDEVFEELFYKYRGKVSAPPEIKLLMMIGGSAMMFHYTNTMMKTLPQMTPEALQGMQAMFANMQAQQGQAQQPQQYQQPPQPQQYQQPQPQAPRQQQPQQAGGARRQMQGPGVDLSALLGGLPSTVPMNGPPLPQPSRYPSMPPVPEVPMPSDLISERLSDVVSDDLDSVPEDLQSVASVSSSERPRGKRGIKSVTIGGGGRRVGTKRTKNVVVI